MLDDTHTKLLMQTSKAVQSLAEANAAAGTMILEQRSMIGNLIETNSKITDILKLLLEQIEQHQNAINELKRKLGDDELPPFDRTRFSFN